MIDISVIIPVYTGENYIKQTLDSILVQTFISFEIIVVDDCSTDCTLDIICAIASKDSRIKYIQTPKNSGGPAAPRNLGIRIARGEWISFCDADDIWHPKN